MAVLISRDVPTFSSVHTAIESMKDDDSYSLLQMVVCIPRPTASKCSCFVSRII